MDFLTMAKQRYSVRDFSDKPIEKEKLDMILESQRVAPTGMNYQSQRILVVDSPEKLEIIRGCYPYPINMPMALLVCYDDTVSAKRPSDGQDFGIVDATIAVTHMLLAISDLGLGSTFMAGFDCQKLSKGLDIPRNIVPVALLPLGYPAENSAPNPRHEERYDLSKTVFHNSFLK